LEYAEKEIAEEEGAATEREIEDIFRTKKRKAKDIVA